MKCDVCGIGDAVVHLTEIRVGVKADRHLCLSCAAKEEGSAEDVAKVLAAWVARQEGRGDSAE